MTQTITVAELEPKAGGKKLSVTDTNGKKWSAWTDKITGLQKGITYEVETKHTPWKTKDGNEIDDWTITKIIVAAVRGPQSNGHTPTQYNNNPGAAVMGMVNQFIARGDVPNDADAIAAQINKCLEAYQKSELN